MKVKINLNKMINLIIQVFNNSKNPLKASKINYSKLKKIKKLNKWVSLFLNFKLKI